jgi:hypothetical protein
LPRREHRSNEDLDEFRIDPILNLVEQKHRALAQQFGQDRGQPKQAVVDVRGLSPLLSFGMGAEVRTRSE